MAFDAELYEAARILAMASVKVPDWEAGYRRVCRWYSKTLATPLMDVLDLPIPFVLQHFYEDLYGGLEQEKLNEIIRDAVESHAEREERLRQEAAADAQLIEAARRDMARMVAQLEARKRRAPAKPEESQKAYEGLAKKLDGILSAAPQRLDGIPIPDEGFKIGE
jgi:hypothetical protein